MSENRRFDWDVLLEKEPDKPPLRAERTEPGVERPIDFEPVFEDMGIPEDIEEQQTVIIPKNQEPESSARRAEKERLEKNRQTEIKRQSQIAVTQQQKPAQRQQTEPKAECKQKQPGLDLLTGNITPNQLVNAFILSEVFGKPKGLRRIGRR